MSKSATIMFARSTSRNSHEWIHSTDDTGRHVLTAKSGGGMRHRIGLLITAMGHTGGLTVKQGAEYLQTQFHESYSEGDAKGAFRVMLKHGIARRRGMVYLLTAHGAQIWKDATKVWK